mgnify:CR=1 FL=1
MIVLQENELVRDIFGLGAVIPAGLPPPKKVSKLERVSLLLNSVSHFLQYSTTRVASIKFSEILINLYYVYNNNFTIYLPTVLNELKLVYFQQLYNSAAFKARTKARSKFRDKRNAGLQMTNNM